MGREEIFHQIDENVSKINDSDIQTKDVMREETELILNKQRTIFNILSVATVITIIITFNI
jgi:hypothetical protein